MISVSDMLALLDVVTVCKKSNGVGCAFLGTGNGGRWA